MGGNVKFNFRGLIAPVFAPFNYDAEKSINLKIIPKYAEYLKDKDINGVLVNGTSGEGMSMNIQERKLIATAWMSSANGLHVMIQIGGAPLPDVLELARHAEEIGAHSLLCLPELYMKPTSSEQLINYLKIVSEAAPNTPLLYYHIPMFTNVNINMGQFLNEIGDKIPSFYGIKFTSNALDEGFQAVLAHNRKFAVFLGADTLMQGSYAIGFDSSIATTLNIYPHLGVDILNHMKNSNYEQARKSQEILTNIVSKISKYGGWVQTMKVAMNLINKSQGLDCGPVRDPIAALTSKQINSMDNNLKMSHNNAQI